MIGKIQAQNLSKNFKQDTSATQISKEVKQKKLCKKLKQKSQAKKLR